MDEFVGEGAVAYCHGVQRESEGGGEMVSVSLVREGVAPALTACACLLVGCLSFLLLFLGDAYSDSVYARQKLDRNSKPLPVKRMSYVVESCVPLSRPGKVK